MLIPMTGPAPRPPSCPAGGIGPAYCVTAVLTNNEATSRHRPGAPATNEQLPVAVAAGASVPLQAAGHPGLCAAQVSLEFHRGDGGQLALTGLEAVHEVVVQGHRPLG